MYEMYLPTTIAEPLQHLDIHSCMSTAMTQFISDIITLIAFTYLSKASIDNQHSLKKSSSI